MSTVLFSCPSMKDLLRSVVTLSRGAVEAGTINWDQYQDGWPKIRIEEAHAQVNKRDVAFLASFEEPGDVFRQMSLIFALPRYGARSLSVILPFFSTGTSDRIQTPGEIVTAATLARMMSSIPHCAGSGPVQIIIYDIHALQERFYFSDNVVPRLESAIPLLREKLRETFGLAPDRYAIAFPDQGAYKRFGHLFPNRRVIVCDKRREGDKRIVTIAEGDPKDRHVVVVDDLVLTGGTLLSSINMLRSAGAASVSCFVTHAVFPESSWKRFLDAGVDRFWFTDSCPATVRAIGRQDPFHVLSLADSIASLLRRDEGRSS